MKTFLREYLGTFSERDRSALKRAIEETIRRIPDGPAPAAAPAAAAKVRKAAACALASNATASSSRL